MPIGRVIPVYVRIIGFECVVAHIVGISESIILSGGSRLDTDFGTLTPFTAPVGPDYHRRRLRVNFIFNSFSLKNAIFNRTKLDETK